MTIWFNQVRAILINQHGWLGVYGDYRRWETYWEWRDYFLEGYSPEKAVEVSFIVGS